LLSIKSFNNDIESACRVLCFAADLRMNRLTDRTNDCWNSKFLNLSID